MLGKALLILSLIVLPGAWAMARTFGPIGPVYPIAEQDLLTLIHQRLAQWQRTGQWQHLMNTVRQTALKRMDRPKPVTGLTRTRQTRTWRFDPSITTTQAIQDHQGRVVVPRGTRVNPLKRHPLNERLVFFDGDDPDQLAWVRQHARSAHRRPHRRADKLILVNGSVSHAVTRLNAPVYFDQQGRLTQRFQLRHVPTVIEQDGAQLRIREVTP